ncbi:SDR family oxidoreductase [Actinomarinicola tropica]|uniref:SDR family oxidoreductase n=1 Tax=Actinomarinicola tropica TaxID=2789776 RepID=A0A5Q2RUD6_9ACTN|nr:SDR family oxidoreductase [Actinomarinicola tropica]QGG96825.1 SDR family oxidoreductase [Actinomarinicola tropica]
MIDLTTAASANGQAIVMGGDTPIGRAVAIELALQGMDVGITWCDDESCAKEVVAEVRATGRWCERRRLDVGALGSDTGALDVVDDLAAALGGLTALVTITTEPEPTDAMDLVPAQWRAGIDGLLLGPLIVAQRAARQMIDRRVAGRIIHVTGAQEQSTAAGEAVTCAARNGLAAASRVMAVELAPHGITVNTVAPGEVAAPAIGQHGVDPWDASRPGVPAGRAAGAHEVAHAVVFLAGPAADYVTGTSLVVDGGLSAVGTRHLERPASLSGL